MNNMNSQRQIPVFNLQSHHAKVQVPAEFEMKDLCRKYNVFPLKLVIINGSKRLLLAMLNPLDHRAIADCEFRSGVSVLPVQADKVDIQWLIQTHYFGRKLSPVAQVDEEDVSHDVFAQLELTTDEQKKPEWVDQSTRAYEATNEDNLK